MDDTKYKEEDVEVTSVNAVNKGIDFETSEEEEEVLVEKEIISVEPEEEKTKVKTEKKLYIDLDMKVEDIISLDKKGQELYFVTGAKFNKLSPEIIRSLSAGNKARYNQAFVETEYEKEEKPTPTLQVRPRFATATARIEVTPLMPGIKFCWKRPEELQSAKLQGYEYAIEGTHCRTFAAKDGETPRIGKGGDTELVLFYISEELHDALIEEVGAKSRRRNEAVETGSQSKLDQLGGQSFKATDDDRDWRKLKNK